MTREWRIMWRCFWDHFWDEFWCRRMLEQLPPNWTARRHNFGHPGCAKCASAIRALAGKEGE